MFECHITIAVKDAEIGEEVAKEHHWKTSEIQRDPVLGKDSYFYLTTHNKTFLEIYSRMEEVINSLKEYGVPIIREKIELIVYDTKVSI